MKYKVVNDDEVNTEVNNAFNKLLNSKGILDRHLLNDWFKLVFLIVLIFAWSLI